MWLVEFAGRLMKNKVVERFQISSIVTSDPLANAGCSEVECVARCAPVSIPGMWSGSIRRSWMFRTICTGGVAALASAAIATRDNLQLTGSREFAGKWQVVGPKMSDGVLVSRKVTTKFDNSNLELRLYQYEACPFCCKVRAFLDYYGFSYEVVEVSPLTRKEIRKLEDVKKLPTVIAQGHRKLSDSSLIISILASYAMQKDLTLEEIMTAYSNPEPSINGGKLNKVLDMYAVWPCSRSPTTKEMEDAERERKWRKWVDDYFIHLIVPNVYRTWDESVQMFRYFEEAGQWKKVVPAWERYTTVFFGSIIMFLMSKKIARKFEGNNVRELLVDACNQWVAAIGESSFLGGTQPNLADLALYGAMNSFVGTETFREICAKTKIYPWFVRMFDCVESKSGATLLEKRFDKKQ